MPEQLFGLSTQDVAILQQLISIHKGQLANTPSRPPTERSWDEAEDHQAPEVFIAKPQTSGGIPRLLPAGTGTGTDQFGTTESGSAYDEPGKAECDIYKILTDSVSGDPELHQMTPFKQVVYNLSSTDLNQEWILIIRTKSGKWIASPTGGNGATTIRFEVTAAGPHLGSTDVDCDFVVATVLGVSCGGNVSVGDEVNVWDPSQCHFNLPMDVLIGAKGTATDMTNNIEGVDCLDERADEGSCRFVIHSLCCSEEICG